MSWWDKHAEYLSLARIQWATQALRREELERDLSEPGARACMARVKLRMTLGSKAGIPPMIRRQS